MEDTPGGHLGGRLGGHPWRTLPEDTLEDTPGGHLEGHLGGHLEDTLEDTSVVDPNPK
jgi:hypothetical protein